MFSRTIKAMYIICSFILTSCSVGDQNMTNKQGITNNEDIIDSLDDEDNSNKIEYYTSIVEIVLTEEETKLEKQYLQSDFGDIGLKYIANNVYQEFENGRKVLVGVLEKPSIESISQIADLLKTREEIFDANIVELPSKTTVDKKANAYLDESYIKLFSETLKPSDFGINLFTHFKEENTSPSYEYTKLDFPEIEIDSLSSFYYQDSWGVYACKINVVLKDNSVENTLNSFLSLRHNNLIRFLAYGVDYETEGGISAET